MILDDAPRTSLRREPPGLPPAPSPGSRKPAPEPGSALRAYGLAALASGVAWLGSQVLQRWLDTGDLPLFLGAVMLGAWAGGLGPALVPTAAGIAVGLTGAGALVMGPHPVLAPATLVRLATFTLEALVIASLGTALRAAQRRAERLTENVQAARRELEATTSRLRNLQRVTDTALSHLHLEALLRELLDRVRDSLGVDTVVILLLDRETDELEVRAAIGLEDEVRQGIRIPVGRGLAGRIAAERRPIVFDDLTRTEIWSPILRDKRLATLLGAPLVVDERVLGVVHVGSQAARRFTEDDTRLLQRVAERMAVAIDRAWLLDRIIAAQEEERRRLARDLHDEAGQSLTSLLVGLRTLEAATGLAETRLQAGALREIALRTLDEVRRLARGLRPRVLDDLGLVAAVEQHAAEYGQAHRMAVDVQARGLEGVRLPPAVETTLYRIVQEGLTNAANHGHARTVSVVLHGQPGAVQAILSDDGQGFEPGALEKATGDGGHLGLGGMRERATLLGGTVTVESTPGEGATVYVRLPLGLS